MAKKPTSLKKIPQKKSSSDSLAFPQKVLAPIKNLLQNQLSQLQKTRKQISREDPFRDKSRTIDPASPDDGAAEQIGHTQSVVLKEQLDRRMIQVKKALTMIKLGKYGICDDCGKMIDTDRLVIEPEATFCANCQRKREK